MARTFDAVSEHLNLASPTAAPASSGTQAFWIKPAFNSGDSAVHVMYDFVGGSGGNNDRLGFTKFSDNNIYCGWLRVSPFDDDRIIISDSGLFTSGAWAHWAFRWDDTADTCALFKNGVSVGSRTSALVTYSVATNGFIGNAHSTGSDARGDMQEWGMWDASLSDDEIAALAKGFSPSLIRPSALQCYLPLVGRQSPERDVVSGQGWTVVGATATDHKGMFYPQAPFSPAGIPVIPPPSVPSAASNVIWF